MKNIKKLLILFLALVMSVSVIGCGGGSNGQQSSSSNDEVEKPITPQGECLVRAGVISDSQLEAGVPSTSSSYYAPEQFEDAMRYYKEKKVDCLFFMGDIVNNAQQQNYDLYNSIMDKVWENREDRPPIIFNLGNHERFTADDRINDTEWTDAQFKNNTGEELQVHKEINGYSFITIPSRVYDSNDSFSRASLNYLKKEVAKADEKAQGKKPIFVGMHEPIAGTVYGDGFSMQSAMVNNILKQYPNVILFTGHSHFPIADERSIYQKDYTSVNTGSSSYCCLGKKLENGKIGNNLNMEFKNVMNDGSYRPMKNEYSGVFAHKQSLGLIVETYENVTTIERRNFRENTRVGDVWYVPTNTTTDDFVYTDARYENGEKATWNEDHNVKLDERQAYSIEVAFDEANWGTSPVETYYIEVLDFGTEEPIQDSTIAIVSDYYAGVGASKYKVKLKLPEKKAYILRITPYDCFGIKGDPWEMDIASYKG